MLPQSHPALTKPETYGLILLALGIVVMAGWVFHWIELTRLLPHLRSMVMGTALSFALLGAALLQRRDGLERFALSARIAVVLVFLHAVATLLQHAFGINLGINLESLHAWADDGNPSPGRMAAITATAFLFASSSFLLGTAEPRRVVAITWLGSVLAVAVLAIGGLSLIGFVLDVHALFGSYPLAGMALHTAAGMAVLGLGLLRILSLAEPNRAEIGDTAALLRLATWGPAALALAVGIIGISVFKNLAQRAELHGLQTAQAARVAQISTLLSLRSTRADLVAHQAALAGDAREVRKTLANLPPFGFDHTLLLSADGVVLGASGSAGKTLLELPLEMAKVGGKLSLVWTGSEIRLRLRSAITAVDGSQRELLSEQSLPELYSLAPGRDDSGGHFQLCGQRQAEIVCLPDSDLEASQTMPLKPLQGSPEPLQLAATQGAGEGQFWRQGRPYRAVYAGVGSTGLLSSYSLDSDRLHAPLRNRLLAGLVLIVLLTLVGTVLLRGRVRLLAGELTRVQRHHKIVVDSLQEGLLLFDSSGNIASANPASILMLGLSRDALTGRSNVDRNWVVVHENGSPMTSEDYPVTQVLRNRQAISNFTLGVEKPGGEVAWLSVDAVPIEGGGVVASMADITARRAAEKQAKEQTRRFELMVDVVKDYAICLLDTEGAVSSWNKGAERFKGYAKEQILGRHFSVFYTPEDRASGKPMQTLQIAATTGRHEEEGWRLTKDGNRLWAHVVLTAIHNDCGELIGFAKVSRDLTERRRTELALAEASGLREAILDASPFAIIATREDGVITSFNPAAERMLWYSRDELVGKATPGLIHDGGEVMRRAHELSIEMGERIEPGFEVFVAKSRRGIVEEREWSYVRKDGSRFPVNLAVTALRDAQRNITGFLGIAYDITERKRREQYTHHVAHHDHLTGLPNRVLMNDRLQLALQHSKRSGKPVAVLLFDLDHFKRVNDTLGHHIGDQLLITVAQRCMACVRGADTVARLGGDEFVVILPDIVDAMTVERIAQSILASVSQPVVIGSHTLQVSSSIGVALYPQDGIDANALLRNADTAMYCAKANGRAEVKLFNADMQKRAIEKMEIEAALHRALKNGEFQLHYQPQVCLRSGAVMGMEALLRWTDLQGKVTAPEVFVPVAEESGQITAIGDWVLRTACSEGRAIQQRLNLRLCLAVNVSSKQFMQTEFVPRLKEILAETGIEPALLELEITESVLMSQAEESIIRLQEIRALGVGIAIDDFGVGYSSLSYITRFPITTLKIDRCFISKVPANQSEAAVTQTIIALAASLNIRVVAEGVETAAQLAYLQACECKEGQGFFFGPGVEEERFTVQGFHFSAAVGQEQIHETLERLQLMSQLRLR